MISYLIKNVFHDINAYLRNLYRISATQNANKKCRIYRSASLSGSCLGKYCVLFENTIIINSSIDSHSYVQRNTRIVNASIGKFCSIAADVSIGPGLHIMGGVSTHPAFYLKNTPLVKIFAKSDVFEPGKRVEIGSDVWIGEKAIVLDGVKIGSGAIIAAGAVVVKDVEPYSIVGGIPAKHIKFRFPENIIEELHKKEWWNQDDEWLGRNQPNFTNISSFLEKGK